MPKEKKRKQPVSKNYFKTALGILNFLFCISFITKRSAGYLTAMMQKKENV